VSVVAGRQAEAPKIGVVIFYDTKYTKKSVSYVEAGMGMDHGGTNYVHGTMHILDVISSVSIVLKMHQNRWWLGLRFRPHWGA